MENVFDELNKIDDEYSLKDYSDEDLKKILRSIKKNRPDLLDDVNDTQELAAAMTKYLDDVFGPIEKAIADEEANQERAQSEKQPIPDGILKEDGSVVIDSTNINEYSFINNKDIKSIVVTDVEEIPPYTFKGCENLKSITFSEDCPLKTIGNSAFMGCAVEKIAFPEKLSKIGNEAFANCTNLKHLILPERLYGYGKKFGFSREAFLNCNSIRVILFKSGNAQAVGKLQRMFANIPVNIYYNRNLHYYNKYYN